MIKSIPVDLSVVVGTADIAIREVLKMSRGTMIPLHRRQSDPSGVYAGDKLVAEGHVVIDGDRLSIQLSRVIADGV